MRIAVSIHITLDIHPLDTLSLAVALGSVLDGGTGEELLAHRNVPDDRTTWSARAVTDATFHEAPRAHRAEVRRHRERKDGDGDVAQRALVGGAV